MTVRSTSVKRKLRAARVRHDLSRPAKLNGRLRLSVFRSNEHIYAQIIDDNDGKTLVSASTIDKKLRKDVEKLKAAEAAVKVGGAIAERAKKAGINEVYFDRSGFRYTGRIKALADAARAGGLSF